jgi:hypothetical protein
MLFSYPEALNTMPVFFCTSRLPRGCLSASLQIISRALPPRPKRRGLKRLCQLGGLMGEDEIKGLRATLEVRPHVSQLRRPFPESKALNRK